MEELIKLKYKGSKVELGQMDAYEVAASILAFSDFLGVICRQAYGEKASLNTSIKGFQQGSFLIDFLLQVTGITGSLMCGGHPSPKDITELINGCINFYKHLKGLPPSKLEKNGEKYSVTNNYGQINYFSGDIVNIISNPKAGLSVQGYIKKQLESDGIESMEITTSHQLEPITIDKAESSYFIPINTDAPFHEYEHKMTLSIISPVFKDGNKWKFSDGNNSFFAVIEDEDFLRKVREGKARFGSGDFVDVDVKVQQINSFNTLKTNYIIVKVISHKESLIQESLF